MSQHSFLNLFTRTLSLGAAPIDPVAFLGESHLIHIRKSISEIGDQDFVTAIEEVIKYLYLSADAPNTLFFPGNKLMDAIWHSLIVETANYRRICETLNPNHFIDHSSVEFEDYLSTHGNQKVVAEQCSWLTSYYKNFGPITASAYSILPLAQSLADRMGVDLRGLNEFASSLVQASEAQQVENNVESDFDVEKFAQEKLSPVAGELDRNPKLVGKLLREFVRRISACRDQGILALNNSELEHLYAASGAFSFTLDQHLSAIERLNGLAEWKAKNSDLWTDLASGKLLCGIATTHLAKPGGAGVQAVECESGFILSGLAPWVCGYGLFDKLIVGFQVGDSIGFGMIDFPHHGDPLSVDGIQATIQKWAFFNGTSTVNIEFYNKLVLKDDLVSLRTRSGPIVPRPSNYSIPDLGIGKGALLEVEKIVGQSNHPKHKLIQHAVPHLKATLAVIEKMRTQGAELDTLIPLRDNFVRDAVRLLGIAYGGRSLEADSVVARLQHEILILDITGHSPQSLKNKISGIGKHDAI